MVLGKWMVLQLAVTHLASGDVGAAGFAADVLGDGA